MIEVEVEIPTCQDCLIRSLPKGNRDRALNGMRYCLTAYLVNGLDEAEALAKGTAKAHRNRATTAAIRACFQRQLDFSQPLCFEPPTELQ